MQFLFTRLEQNQEIVLRFTAEIFGKAAIFILTMLLARTLGVTGFAAIGNANLIVAAALPLLSFGLSFTLVRITASLVKGSSVAAHYYTSLLVAGFAAIVFSIFFWGFSSYITHYLFDEQVWLKFVKLISFYCLFTVLELVTMETLRARQLIKSASFLQIAAALVNLSACALLSLNDSLTPINTLGILTISRLGTSLVAHVLLIIYGQITLKIHLCSFTETKSALLLGIQFAASGFGTWLIEHGDRFVLTSLMKQADFGPYLAALTILSVIPICGAPFWYLLFPRLAKAHGENNTSTFCREGKKSISDFSVIVFPVGIFVTVSLPNLLPALAGEAYNIDYLTSLALTLSLLAIQLGSPWEYACIVTGNSKRYLANTLFFGISGVLLGALFVQYLGPLGAALSAIISRLGLSVSLYIHASRLGYGKSMFPDSSIILSILLASVPTSIFCIFLLQQKFFVRDQILESIFVYGVGFIPIFLLYFYSYKSCRLLINSVHR